MSDLAVIVSYERICGTVASLLFLFARIESEGRKIVGKALGPERLTTIRGVRGALRVWKDLVVSQAETRPQEALLAQQLWAQIQEPLSIRNGICHGLLGASAEQEDAKAVLVWRDTDGTKSRTYDELQEMFAWLSKVPHAMGMISQALTADDLSKLRPLPGRDFWEGEFDIRIPEVD